MQNPLPVAPRRGSGRLSPVDLIVWPHWTYIALAGVATAFQGWRGWHNQLVYGNNPRHQNTPYTGKQSYWSFVLSHCLADAILYVVSSVVGFASFFLAYRGFDEMIPVMKDASGGAVALLVFLLAVGVLGVSGQLPWLIQQGKLPGLPSGK